LPFKLCGSTLKKNLQPLPDGVAGGFQKREIPRYPWTLCHLASHSLPPDTSEAVKKLTISRKDAKAQRPACKNLFVCPATLADFAPLREIHALLDRHTLLLFSSGRVRIGGTIQA
jgi:hypothetical protein